VERERLQPDEHVAWVFSGLREPIRRLLSRIRVSEQELEVLERDLYAWFLRLSRRPGCGALPDKAMQATLLIGAVELMRKVAALKHCPVPLVPQDVGELARELGVELGGDGGPHS